jgi:ketosteroid isomerase-like protein
MYHTIVKKQIASVFGHLNKGHYEYVLSGIGTTIEYHFAGSHCLGGRRTRIGAMRLWFERLFRLFQNLQFEIHSVAISRYPWDSTAVVEWTDGATPIDGKNYVNSGVHVIRVRWGKVARIHAYLSITRLTEWHSAAVASSGSLATVSRRQIVPPKSIDILAAGASGRQKPGVLSLLDSGEPVPECILITRRSASTCKSAFAWNACHSYLESISQ